MRTESGNSLQILLIMCMHEWFLCVFFAQNVQTFFFVPGQVPGRGDKLGTEHGPRNDDKQTGTGATGTTGRS